VLHGTTNAFARRYTEITPYYPVESLPTETKEHICSIRRPCPMSSILEAFRCSNTFSLKLLEELTPASCERLCRIYKCRIVSIDGRVEKASPVLCLKLFDDRFFPMEPPSEELMEESLQWWWTQYLTAEGHVASEDAAYKRLYFLQGSLIPWFYGSHSLTLPNNHELFGILMEFVPAQALSTGIADTLSPGSQIQLIQSIRHAVRALQCADVSQHDWHTGQIMCNTSVERHSDEPLAPSAHCVLIDFSSTTQSVEEEIHRTDDFGDILRILLEPSTQLDAELVWKHFSTRESWDLISSSVLVNNQQRFAQATDPFEFVYK